MAGYHYPQRSKRESRCKSIKQEMWNLQSAAVIPRKNWGSRFIPTKNEFFLHFFSTFFFFFFLIFPVDPLLILFFLCLPLNFFSSPVYLFNPFLIFFLTYFFNLFYSFFKFFNQLLVLTKSPIQLDTEETYFSNLIV